MKVGGVRPRLKKKKLRREGGREERKEETVRSTS